MCDSWPTIGSATRPSGVARTRARTKSSRAPFRRNADRDDFVRARVGSGGRLEPILGQESHMIARAAAADALVLAPRGDGELAAGSGVRYLLLR